MSGLNQTHDPARRSWVESANDPDQDFPIQNLPFGAFSTDGGSVHIGVAIGDRILDLTVLEECGLVCPANDSVFASGVLNPFKTGFVRPPTGGDQHHIGIFGHNISTSSR